LEVRNPLLSWSLFSCLDMQLHGDVHHDGIELCRRREGVDACYCYEGV
jgi:hypothetical protein